MIKICHVTSAHEPEDGRIFRRACVSTALAGYETYLVEKGSTYDKNGVHIIGVGVPRRNNRIYRMCFFKKRIYNAAVEIDADIYQLHDPELLPYAFRLKKKGKKVIFDSHENYPEQIQTKPYLPRIIAKIVASVFNHYSIRVFAKIDGITYPTEDEYFEKLKQINSRSVVTNNYPWLNELYEKYDKDCAKEENTACYVGAITENRGIVQMIKACYKAGCRLYLAGNCDELFMKRISSMDEFSIVTYLGVVDRGTVVEIYKKTQIGLNILLNVGQYWKAGNLSTKVYEYMAMGLPVIISESAFNIHILQEHKFGFAVDPEDIDKVTMLIGLLLNDEALRNEMGHVGRKLISDRFNWNLEQEKLLDLYKILV